MTDQGGTWPTNQTATASFTNSAGQPAVLTFPVPQVTVIPMEQGHPELVCRDHGRDDGALPSNKNGEAWWDSPDIWVRNEPDAIASHQNPMVGQTNYLYVRVTNRGSAAAGPFTVRAYDAAGAASIRWPDDWAPELGSAQVQGLGPGASTVVAIPWRPTMEGHFCFLARIDSSDDPIAHDGWVPFENNICQRNVQVLSGGAEPASVGAGNRGRGTGYGSVTVRSANFPTRGGGGVLDSLQRATGMQAPEGVRVQFTDAGLFQRWLAAGGSVTGGEILQGESAVMLTVFDRGGRGVIDARLDRLPYEDEETSALEFTVEAPSGGDVPTIEIAQWMDGQAVGGNVLRPEVRFPHVIYLPELKTVRP
jgi:hypothetical protein